VSEPRLLRVTTSASLREKRLRAVLGGRDPRDPRLRAAVDDAMVAGSLELAGFAVTPPEVAAARAGAGANPAVQGLLRALRAVDAAAPLDVDRLRAWHAAAMGTTGAWRAAERAREGGPPPAPARFIDLRLRTLEQWLGVESGRELAPFQQGALAMARIVEILPWDDGNGRVARLAAAHLMVRAGSRPPVLAGADAPRLRETLQAAFQLHTEPLCALLQEASERALDVMIAAVEEGALERAPR
jgi:hypothetical protein